MKCLHCGKKLPMVKKLTSEEFCSVAHRKAYHDEQEQLALARLLEDQQRKKPARKPLQKPVEPEFYPEFADFLSQPILPRNLDSQPWLRTGELVFDGALTVPTLGIQLEIPRQGLAGVQKGISLDSPYGETCVDDSISALISTELISSLNAIQLATIESSPTVCGSLVLESPVPIAVAPEEPLAPEFAASPVCELFNVTLPASGLQPWQHVPVEVMDFTRAAGAQLPFDLAMRFAPAVPAGAPAVNPYGPVVHTVWRFDSRSGLPLASGLPSETSVQIETPDDWEPALPETQLHFPEVRLFEPSSYSPELAKTTSEIACHQVLPESLALDTEWLASPSAASRCALPCIRHELAPNAEKPLVAAAKSFVAREPEMVSFAGSIPRLFTRPPAVAARNSELLPSSEIAQATPKALLLAQSKSAKDILERPFGKCEPFDDQFSHPENFLKSISADRVAADSLFAFNDPIVPKARIASVRRSSLTVLAKTYRASKQIRISVHPDPAIKVPVMREWTTPEKKTMILPVAKLAVLPARSTHSALSALNHFSGGGTRISWAGIQNRWREAPNDLRWIAIAVPLVIGLIWLAKSPSAQDGAKGRLTSMIPNVSGMLNASFNSDSLEGLKQNIQRRAAVELSDDFRQGLGDWSGVGDWSRGWKYDPAGFIRPRQLALYTPSLALEDYHFEFLGAIERKALSWVFRAADVKNYYAARLEVTRGGPLPTVELVRYAVIKGRPGPKKSIPLPMQGRTDTIYRVRVDVVGQDFVTSIQGQVVDVFTDDRLARGGVGFFSEPGEDARLRWVEVSHQYDMLGRLCAYLVPYNVSNSTVRSAP